jgi:hypothetical protein
MPTLTRVVIHQHHMVGKDFTEAEGSAGCGFRLGVFGAGYFYFKHFIYISKRFILHLY